MKPVNFSVHVKCKTDDWMLGCEGWLRSCSRHVVAGLWLLNNLNKNLQSQMTLKADIYIYLDLNSFSKGSGVRHRWRLKGNSTNCFPRTTADVKESTLKHAVTPEEAACNLINCLQRCQSVGHKPGAYITCKSNQPNMLYTTFFSRKQTYSPRSVNTWMYIISGLTL